MHTIKDINKLSTTTLSIFIDLLYNFVFLHFHVIFGWIRKFSKLWLHAFVQRNSLILYIFLDETKWNENDYRICSWIIGNELLVRNIRLWGCALGHSHTPSDGIIMVVADVAPSGMSRFSDLASLAVAPPSDRDANSNVDAFYRIMVNFIYFRFNQMIVL